MHAAAYYLSPQYHFEHDFKLDNIEIKNGLYNCVSMLVSDATVREIINAQLVDFHFCNGPFFDNKYAKKSRKTLHPAQWLRCMVIMIQSKRFDICVLSLTYSFSRYEHNWSAFEILLIEPMTLFIVYNFLC